MNHKIKTLSIWLIAAASCSAANLNLETLRPQKSDAQMILIQKQTEALAYLATNIPPTNVTAIISGISVVALTNLATATMGTLNVVIADAAVPIVLGSATNTFQSITFTAYSAARTANTATVYLQIVSTNESLAIPLDVGGSVTWTAPPGKLGNAAQWYVDGPVGAGTVAIWSK